MRLHFSGLLLASALLLACGDEDSPAPNAQAQGGNTGASGQAGASGASGQAGASGASGQAGASGASGQAGASGASGQAGASGASGQAGAAGSASDPCGAAPGEGWARCGKNPLVVAGKPYQGTSERAKGKRVLGMGDPDVLYDADEPDPQRRYKAFWSVTFATTFAGPKSDQVMAIQRATSPDGVSWTVADEPALWAGEAGAWDALHIETPSVVKLPPSAQGTGVVYVMAYAGAGAEKTIAGGAALPWYQIGLAVSADGEVWQKLPAAQSPYTKEQAGFDGIDGLVLLGKEVFGPGKVSDGLVADPEILYKDGKFHLFYSSFGVDEAGAIAFPTAYGTSHSTSADAVSWAHQANNPQFFGGTQPSLVTRDDGTHELFLVADEDAEVAQKMPSAFNPYLGMRRVESKELDALSAGWPALPPRDFEWDGTFLPEKQGLVKAGDVLLLGGVYHYFYVGMGGETETIPEGFFTPVKAGTVGAKQIGDLWIIEAVTSLNLARRR